VSNWDQVEGEVKEQAGKLTGDDELEDEGKGQEFRGDVKDKAEDVKDKAADVADDITDKI
jgi:uncharacterized protein YjbJ (UPF0337 family)